MLFVRESVCFVILRVLMFLVTKFLLSCQFELDMFVFLFILPIHLYSGFYTVACLISLNARILILC